MGHRTRWGCDPMRESEDASMRIDETCLARVQVAREWRGCWTNCRQDQKLARKASIAARDWWKWRVLIHRESLRKSDRHS